jgi:hypothetical protein
VKGIHIAYHFLLKLALFVNYDHNNYDKVYGSDDDDMMMMMIIIIIITMTTTKTITTITKTTAAKCIILFHI